MNRKDFEELVHTTTPARTISYYDLSEVRGTLLYGYDVDRNSFHVYLKEDDELIHVFIYNLGVDEVEYFNGMELDVSLLYPNKRVYPESTNLHFAWLLKKRGGDPTYALFSDERYEKVKDEEWHGRVWEA